MTWLNGFLGTGKKRVARVSLILPEHDQVTRARCSFVVEAGKGVTPSGWLGPSTIKSPSSWKIMVWMWYHNGQFSGIVPQDSGLGIGSPLRLRGSESSTRNYFE